MFNIDFFSKKVLFNVELICSGSAWVAGNWTILPLQRGDAWGSHYLTLGLGAKNPLCHFPPFLQLFKAGSSSGIFPHSPVVVGCAHLPVEWRTAHFAEQGRCSKTAPFSSCLSYPSSVALGISLTVPPLFSHIYKQGIIFIQPFSCCDGC